MNENLEKLREIGAQKIYEDTHIPIEHVQAIIHESFDGFSKVQFVGFISIFEREYGEDLSEIKRLGLQYFEEQNSTSKNEAVFVSPKKKRNFTPYYIVLAVIIFVLAAYFNMDKSSKMEVPHKIDNSVIENAQKTMTPVDINISIDQNSTVVDENKTVEVTKIEIPKVEKTLKIVTKTKVWLGYINLKTNEHYNKVFTGEFSLNPNHDWLLVFGHSFIDIVLNEEIVKLNSKGNVRFLYKDGEIKTISKKEFKKLNRGRSW